MNWECRGGPSVACKRVRVEWLEQGSFPRDNPQLGQPANCLARSCNQSDSEGYNQVS